MCKLATQEICTTKIVDPEELVVILQHMHKSGSHIAEGCGLIESDPVPHKEIEVNLNFNYFIRLLRQEEVFYIAMRPFE